MSDPLLSLIREAVAGSGARSDEELAAALRAALAPAKAEPVQTITIVLQPGATYSQTAVAQLFDQINEGLKNGHRLDH